MIGRLHNAFVALVVGAAMAAVGLFVALVFGVFNLAGWMAT